MKKLNLAIIGQGRSGRDIHGAFYKKAENTFFRVAYVVEADEERRERAAAEYPGCVTFADYRELFACEDIDLVVNATYSNLHYPITRELLLHGFNVLCEKPAARIDGIAQVCNALLKPENFTLYLCLGKLRCNKDYLLAGIIPDRVLDNLTRNRLYRAVSLKSDHTATSKIFLLRFYDSALFLQSD